MRFNANRLAHLAGIEVPSRGRSSLNESGNQSRHDEKFDDGYDYYIKGDLNERDDIPHPFAEQGGGYQGGYADMGGFEGYR